MKAQHQISFKRKRSGRPRAKLGAAKVTRKADARNVTGAVVQVGERELKFARALSDTEKSVRDASLVSLRSWLTEHRNELHAAELDRLWKGLFYCIWMADKRPIITTTISAVIGLQEVLGWPFMEALCRCLVREWFGIDRHRVDKYYELLNSALKLSVSKVIQEEDNEDFFAQLRILLVMLETEIWHRANKGGLGVALHFLDVYVDQVVQPVLLRGRKLSGNDVHMVYDDLLKNMYEMTGSSEGHSVAVGKRVSERVLSRLIEVVQDTEISLKPKDQRDMIVRTSKRVFSIAACKSTADDVRVDLYELRTAMKAFAAKRQGKDDSIEINENVPTEDIIAEGQSACEEPEQTG